MSEITNQDVGEALGWKICHVQHSKTHTMKPYWDDNGGYICSEWSFEPTIDIHDALSAIEYLIDTEKITAMEICAMIMNHITNKRIFEKEQS